MLRPIVLLVLALACGACGSGALDPEPYRGTASNVPAGSDGSVTLFSLQRPNPDTLDVDIDASAILSVVTDSLSTTWDLGFRGTEILLNGGASGPGAGVGVVVPAAFNDVEDALNDDYTYRRDGESPCPSGPARAVCTAAGDGWFETFPLAGGGEAIVPIDGSTLLLRLGNGQGYAKVRFESYYRGAPDVGVIDNDSEGGVYTFEYFVNPDGASFVETE